MKTAKKTILQLLSILEKSSIPLSEIFTVQVAVADAKQYLNEMDGDSETHEIMSRSESVAEALSLLDGGEQRQWISYMLECLDEYSGYSNNSEAALENVKAVIDERLENGRW